MTRPFTPADIGRRVIYRYTLPPGEEFGTFVGLTEMPEFVVVRFDGDARDEAASAEWVRFLDEQGEGERDG